MERAEWLNGTRDKVSPFLQLLSWDHVSPQPGEEDVGLFELAGHVVLRMGPLIGELQSDGWSINPARTRGLVHRSGVAAEPLGSEMRILGTLDAPTIVYSYSSQTGTVPGGRGTLRWRGSGWTASPPKLADASIAHRLQIAPWGKGTIGFVAPIKLASTGPVPLPEVVEWVDGSGALPISAPKVFHTEPVQLASGELIALEWQKKRPKGCEPDRDDDPVTQDRGRIRVWAPSDTKGQVLELPKEIAECAPSSYPFLRGRQRQAIHLLLSEDCAAGRHWKYDGAQWTRINDMEGVGDISGVELGSDESLWATSEERLWRLDGDATDTKFDKSIWRVLVRSADDVWVVTAGGVFRSAPETKASKVPFESLADKVAELESTWPPTNECFAPLGFIGKVNNVAEDALLSVWKKDRVLSRRSVIEFESQGARWFGFEVVAYSSMDGPDNFSAFRRTLARVPGTTPFTACRAPKILRTLFTPSDGAPP